MLITKEELGMIPDWIEIVKVEQMKEWASRFQRADPRHQIMTYFDDVAVLGVGQIAKQGRVDIDKILPILKMFHRSAIFTVWRPTSAMDEIRQMMKGNGVGKGLDVNVKSAILRGRLSGFVPFMQIYEECHKSQIRTLPKKSEMRIFFSSRKPCSGCRGNDQGLGGSPKCSGQRQR